MRKDRFRMMAIMIISIVVIITGILFAFMSFRNGEVGGGILGIVIIVTILAFAIIVYKRGNRDLKEGFPLKDERSRRVVEKAGHLSFMLSLYLLLGISMLLDSIISFRDQSQVLNVIVGLMALLFAISWLYYNKRAV